MNALARRRRGRGQSLISLLVGLAISLITIAAMLVLYKTMIGISGNASRSALRDSQVSAALLAAQMNLQSAGFGVPATDALASKWAISAGGKQVVWRSKTALADAGYQCAGLLIDDDGDDRGLYRLPPKACASVADATWTDDEREPMAGGAAFFTPTQKDGSAFTGSDAEAGAITLAPGYVFALGAPRPCLPYMQQNFAAAPAAQAQQLTLQRADGAGALFSICLPNLAVTP